MIKREVGISLSQVQYLEIILLMHLITYFCDTPTLDPLPNKLKIKKSRNE